MSQTPHPTACPQAGIPHTDHHHDLPPFQEPWATLGGDGPNVVDRGFEGRGLNRPFGLTRRVNLFVSSQSWPSWRSAHGSSATDLVVPRQAWRGRGGGERRGHREKGKQFWHGLEGGGLARLLVQSTLRGGRVFVGGVREPSSVSSHMARCMVEQRRLP